MATASQKINKSNKKAAGNGEVVAEKGNIGDGYIDTESRQTSAKATANETPSAATKKAASEIDRTRGLDNETLIGLYRTMYMSRRIDDKEIQLKGQNKIFFQISGAGHEAVLVGAALAMKAAYERFFRRIGAHLFPDAEEFRSADVADLFDDMRATIPAMKNAEEAAPAEAW